VNETTLTRMYGIPVEVDQVHGHRIVVARRRNLSGEFPTSNTIV
jgi:hypothetical protein